MSVLSMAASLEMLFMKKTTVQTSTFARFDVIKKPLIKVAFLRLGIPDPKLSKLRFALSGVLS